MDILYLLVSCAAVYLVYLLVGVCPARIPLIFTLFSYFWFFEFLSFLVLQNCPFGLTEWLTHTPNIDISNPKKTLMLRSPHQTNQHTIVLSTFKHVE